MTKQSMQLMRRFKDLTAVLLKNHVLCDVTRCNGRVI